MKLPDSFPVEIKRGNVTVKIYRTANKGYEEFKLVYYGADGSESSRHSPITQARRSRT